MTKLHKRRIIYGILILVVLLFRRSFGGFLKIENSVPMLLLPLIVAISMHESCAFSVFFGAIAGLMTDMFSVSTDGFFAISFAVTAFAVSNLTVFFLRRTFVSSAVLTLLFSLLMNVAYWLLFVVIKGYAQSRILLFEKYIPTAIYTFVFVLLFYPIVNVLFKKTSETQLNE